MNNEGKWARERDEERRRRVKARRQRAIRIQSTEQGRRRIGPGRIPAVCVADKRGQLVLNTQSKHRNKGWGPDSTWNWTGLSM